MVERHLLSSRERNSLLRAASRREDAVQRLDESALARYYRRITGDGQSYSVDEIRNHLNRTAQQYRINAEE